ncbi:hypothetical protein [Salidesulfovibrio brasiliensis]|uniref:hypothetical protein n=1 Tax=Salidesulfovibrio brasiliensis TaxID=221711 RepID=UPI000A3F7334|nr:hypothetical protein [Salidesulfovibrio brasiliensis]
MIGRVFRLTGRGIADFAVHPFAHLLTLTAVAMVAFLAGFVLLTLHNVNLQLLKSRGQVEFQLYWSPDANPQVVQSEWQKIADMSELEEFRAFTPEDASSSLPRASASPATSRGSRSRTRCRIPRWPRSPSPRKSRPTAGPPSCSPN